MLTSDVLSWTDLLFSGGGQVCASGNGQLTESSLHDVTSMSDSASYRDVFCLLFGEIIGTINAVIVEV